MGASCSAEDSTFMDAFGMASKGKTSDLAAILKVEPALLHKKGGAKYNGGTILHVAVVHDQDHTVAWLLQNGASATAVNHSRDSILHLAVSKGSVNSLAIIAQYLADPSRSDQLTKLLKRPNLDGKLFHELDSAMSLRGTDVLALVAAESRSGFNAMTVHPDSPEKWKSPNPAYTPSTAAQKKEKRHSSKSSNSKKKEQKAAAAKEKAEEHEAEDPALEKEKERAREKTKQSLMRRYCQSLILMEAIPAEEQPATALSIQRIIETGRCLREFGVLLKTIANNNFFTRSVGQTGIPPVLLAIRHNQLQALQLLLDCGGSRQLLEATDGLENHALHYAVELIRQNPEDDGILQYLNNEHQHEVDKLRWKTNTEGYRPGEVGDYVYSATDCSTNTSNANSPGQNSLGSAQVANHSGQFALPTVLSGDFTVTQTVSGEWSQGPSSSQRQGSSIILEEIPSTPPSPATLSGPHVVIRTATGTTTPSGGLDGGVTTSGSTSATTPRSTSTAIAAWGAKVQPVSGGMMLRRSSGTSLSHPPIQETPVGSGSVNGLSGSGFTSSGDAPSTADTSPQRQTQVTMLNVSALNEAALGIDQEPMMAGSPRRRGSLSRGRGSPATPNPTNVSSVAGGGKSGDSLTRTDSLSSTDSPLGGSWGRGSLRISRSTSLSARPPRHNSVPRIGEPNAVSPPNTVLSPEEELLAPFSNDEISSNGSFSQSQVGTIVAPELKAQHRKLLQLSNRETPFPSSPTSSPMRSRTHSPTSPGRAHTLKFERSQSNSSTEPGFGGNSIAELPQLPSVVVHSSRVAVESSSEDESPSGVTERRGTAVAPMRRKSTLVHELSHLSASTPTQKSSGAGVLHQGQPLSVNLAPSASGANLCPTPDPELSTRAPSMCTEPSDAFGSYDLPSQSFSDAGVGPSPSGSHNGPLPRPAA